MKRSLLILFVGVFLGISEITPVMHAQAKGAAATPTTILLPADTAKLAPGTVFFRGQSATLQMRNTYGLRFPDGAIVLAGLVDSSGYSSGVQQKYQGYLITEVPLDFSGKKLPPGAYGFGFIAPNTFVVMDLGAHDLLRVPWTQDTAIQRPRPFQIVNATEAGEFRLYEGRKAVSFSREK